MALSMHTNNIKKSNRPVYGRTFRVMGTDVTAEIVLDEFVTPKMAEQHVAEVENIFRQHETIFSRFDEKSELTRINSHLNEKVPVSSAMLEVLELCQKFHELTEGYFDPRIIGNLERIGYDRDFRSHDLSTETVGLAEPEIIQGNLADDLKIDKLAGMVLVKKRIDTTGIVKGYTVDQAAEYLRRSEVKNFVVDAGGDMQASGRNADGQLWGIGIEGLAGDAVALKLQDEGIATSGISRKRWTVGNQKVHHLINPKDPGSFSHNLKTVTVIAEKTVEADGRAKALFLMGKENGLKFAEANDIKGLFLDYQNNVYVSQSIKENMV
ncbi:FAD:protein FMN transferase [Patescibacteria group bacterium]|nr:MAG: FAD:protein FMN transferase [Patescibacteria group bacterium]